MKINKMLLKQNNVILLIMTIVMSLLYSTSLLKLDTIYASTDSVTNTTSEKSIPVYMITTRGDFNFL